jgi:precorrin-2/cobalt-factor-2 C20-methyltransferase
MNKIKGKFFSVGTGPGDPKLMTYLAVETLRRCCVIAVPDSGASENMVLKIVRGHLSDQQVVLCDMPMVRDRKILEKSHQAAAEKLSVYLEEGRDVGFLTLGDPTVYSTAMYVHQRIKEMGYDTEVIPGVTSFCAAAAKLNIPLCEGGEMLHIVPASYMNLESILAMEGNTVLMKSGKSIAVAKPLLEGRNAMAVECCGMENEKIHMDLSGINEDSSYFSVLVVRGENL